MTSSRRLTLLAIALLIAPAAGRAADGAVMPSAQPGEAMPMLPGLKVGDRAPSFTLKDAAGKEVALTSLLANGRVALVFYRSADWCPFCIAQLKELEASLPAFEKAGVTLVGISYDAVETLAKAAPKHGLTFPLLSDEGSRIIDAYGIRNHEARGRGAGIPHPAIFVLDHDGVIRAKLMHEGYRTRPKPEEIIAAAKDVM